ncbi:hypothetical protein [Serratia symbiotica]|uniref:hypothetical protein n=1 Tax=Serratia symbiotica TaxID=138074 RepID=UPI003463D82C
METIYFVYISADKKVAAYAVNNPSHSERYVQGFSPSESGYRTFRKDRFIKSFERFDDAKKHADLIAPTIDASQYIFPEKRHDSLRKYDAPVFDCEFEICFTGFKKADKDRLIERAKLAGMIVRSEVTVNLHLLCYGYNAGPKKMELARMKGTIVLNEDEFLSLIETGEIPDVYS